MTNPLEELQKALEQWWEDYNHLLGDASGDSECRQKLHRIIRLFSAFQKDHEELVEKNLEYAKLVAAQAEEYAEKLKDKVVVSRKQLSETFKTWNWVYNFPNNTKVISIQDLMKCFGIVRLESCPHRLVFADEKEKGSVEVP